MSATPIIGFDAKRIVRNGTGLGSYGRTLVSDLSAYPLSLRLYAPDEGRAEFRSQVLGPSNVSLLTPRSSIMPGALWRSYGIVRDLQRDGVQLYHGLSGELPIGIKRSGIKTVVTIHDLIFLRHPEFYHPIDVKLYTWKFRQTLKEADHIIAISECTKRDILYYGGQAISPDKISLIYQAHASRFHDQVSADAVAQVRHQYGITMPFVLSVGSIEARKNIRLAVRALAHLPSAIHLVAVGKSTAYSKQVEQEAIKSGLGHRVHFLHGVPDEHLNILYHEAEAFVYPSFYEGFGIPIIEAIRCGLPVVACTGSCLEEAGGPDSLYVSPDDAEGMAHAIRQSLKGAADRQERIRRSLDYIRRFDGNDVAGQVYALYQQLIAGI